MGGELGRRHAGKPVVKPRAASPSGGAALTAPGRLHPLEGQDWVESFTFTTYGARLGVRANDSALLQRLRADLPPNSKIGGWKLQTDVLYSAWLAPAAKAGEPRGVHLLYAGLDCIARFTDVDRLVEFFEHQIHLAVATHARGFAFIHAGAVAWRGRALIIPGRSMAGKTSLVKALVTCGADYLSDEYAVIDPRGAIHPYPRALSIRIAHGTRRKRVPASELGARTRIKPVPLGLVASVRYVKKAKGALRRLTRGEAAIELLSNSVGIRLKPKLTLALINRAVATCAAVKGTRGEARRMAPLLFGEQSGSLSRPTVS